MFQGERYQESTCVPESPMFHNTKPHSEGGNDFTVRTQNNEGSMCSSKVNPRLWMRL